MKTKDILAMLSKKARERQSKNKKKEIPVIILAVLFAGIVFAGVYYYKARLQNSLWTQSVSDIVKEMSLKRQIFDTYAQKEAELVHGLAIRSEKGNSSDESLIHENLDLCSEIKNSYAIVDLKNGVIYYAGDAERYNLDDNLASYEELGKKGIFYLNDYTGQNAMISYERITFKDGCNGIVFKEIMVSELLREFSPAFNGDTGFSCIVNRTGDILLNFADEAVENVTDGAFSNIFDLIKPTDRKEQHIVDEFREDIENGRNGMEHFIFNDEEYIFAYTSVGDTGGWSLISVIPNSAIMKQTNRIVKISQIIIFVVTVIVLFATLILFLLHRNHKNILENEIEILYREQLFDILANNTNDVFLMFSAENNEVEYISPNIERIIGIDYLGVDSDLTALKENGGYKDGEGITVEMLKGMEKGTSISAESERINPKTGEHRNFLVTVYRAIVGGCDKFIVVWSDRTVELQGKYALKEALNIAKAANESKGRFLSSMSHDLRTPLNAISGLTLLLQHDAENPEKVRKHAQKISASSQHLLEIINDVLDMSKIENGKTTLNISEFSISELLEELEDIVRPQTNAKEQSFSIETVGIDSQDVRLMGDKLRISRILLNILSNAVKYTPNGGKIKLMVRQILQGSKNIASIQFSVRDNGIGMSEEYLHKIFQPFTREDNSTTSKVQGTGLGMAITKNLLDIMGGTVEIESRVGEGTSFIINLELLIAKNSEDIGKNITQTENAESVLSKTFIAETDTTAALQTSEKSGKAVGTMTDITSGRQINVLMGKRFLIAEDNELNAEILGELLDMKGAIYDNARNGKEALEMFEKSKPGKYDLIFMDIQMPVMNGYEAVRAIRSCGHECAKTIPIAAMTANAFTEDINAAFAAGINAYITKPIDMENVEKVVSKLL